MNEMPTMLAAGYATSTMNLDRLDDWTGQIERRIHALPNTATLAALNHAAQQQPKKESVMARRLVQVFIADPNENVPLADSLLYSGEQKLTDLTDQELFFEIDINSLLKAHNEKRVKIVNKAVKERTEYLEPARIRDLKMVVVSVATF